MHQRGPPEEFDECQVAIPPLWTLASYSYGFICSLIRESNESVSNPRSLQCTEHVCLEVVYGSEMFPEYIGDVRKLMNML